MSLLQKTIIYIFFIFSIIVGLFLEENSAGGALHDYNYVLPYIKSFEISIKLGMENFMHNSGAIMHTPFYYIFISFINNLFNQILITKFFYILISSFLPLLFYVILKNKFIYNKDLLFLFSCVIFFSPYFRSSAIWMLGDNLALIFFSISIIFLIKFEKSKNFFHFILCLTSIILCCYIRYYYVFFYFYYFFKCFNQLNLRYIIISLILSFLISLPALIYFFYIIKYHSFLNAAYNYTKINYFGNIYLILSLILFYIIPFVYLNLNKIKNYYLDNKSQIFIFSLPLVILYLFDLFFSSKNIILFSDYGGGVFRKLIDLMGYDLNISLLVLSILSLLLLNYYLKENLINNYSLFALLFLSFPMSTIFQKYFDPLLFLILFGLINYSKKINLLILNRWSLLSAYLYFFSFYVFSIYYYY